MMKMHLVQQQNGFYKAFREDDDGGACPHRTAVEEIVGEHDSRIHTPASTIDSPEILLIKMLSIFPRVNLNILVEVLQGFRSTVLHQRRDVFAASVIGRRTTLLRLVWS